MNNIRFIKLESEMKKIITISFSSLIAVLFIAANLLAQPKIDSNYTAPLLPTQYKTFANIADPSQVLVIYKKENTGGSTTDSIGIFSTALASYYQEQRNIPSANLYGLDLPDRTIYDGNVVKLVKNDEIIKDSTTAKLDSASGHDMSISAWKYFDEHIFTKIQDHLKTTIVNGDTLKNKIRYVLICKGIPYRLQARFDWSGIGFYSRWNIGADELLCFLNQPNPNFSILSLYGTGYGSFGNPYYRVDDGRSMNWRFVSNHFTINDTLRLSYLVSRLDGLTYDKVYDMIDHSVNVDKSGNGIWVLDNHNVYPQYTPYFVAC
jgi:uncharacterized protein (TIGR03790 family)